MALIKPTVTITPRITSVTAVRNQPGQFKMVCYKCHKDAQNYDYDGLVNLARTHNCNSGIKSKKIVKSNRLHSESVGTGKA